MQHFHVSTYFSFPFIAAGDLELTSAVQYMGRPVEHVAVTAHVPPGAAPMSPTLTVAEVAGDHVRVKTPGYKAKDIQLPFAVSAEGATAAFEQGGCHLKLTLPYLPCRGFIQLVCCSWIAMFVVCVALDSKTS